MQNDRFLPVPTNKQTRPRPNPAETKQVGIAMPKRRLIESLQQNKAKQSKTRQIKQYMEELLVDQLRPREHEEKSQMQTDRA